MPAKSTRTEDAPLTKRELEVIEMVARGYENEQVAEALGISRNAVIAYMKRICIYLQAANRTEAAVQAVRRGLI